MLVWSVFAMLSDLCLLTRSTIQSLNNSIIIQGKEQNDIMWQYLRKVTHRAEWNHFWVRNTKPSSFKLHLTCRIYNIWLPIICTKLHTCTLTVLQSYYTRFFNNCLYYELILKCFTFWNIVHVALIDNFKMSRLKQ